MILPRIPRKFLDIFVCSDYNQNSHCRASNSSCLLLIFHFKMKAIDKKRFERRRRWRKRSSACAIRVNNCECIATELHWACDQIPGSVKNGIRTRWCPLIRFICNTAYSNSATPFPPPLPPLHLPCYRLHVILAVVYRAVRICSS